MPSVGVAFAEPAGEVRAARRASPAAAPEPRRAGAVPGPHAPPPLAAADPPPPSAAVLDAIYDAALEPERWPGALAALAAALGGSAATLHAGPAAGPSRVAAAFGLDEAALREHRRRHCALDPFAGEAARRAAWAAPITAREAAAAGGAELERTGSFAAWMLPNGFGDALCVGLAPPGTAHRADVRVLRPPRAPRFGPAEAAALSRLAPHLRRAAELNRRLAPPAQASPAPAAALAEAFDRFAAGVALLDAGGVLLWANRAAHSLLRSGDGLSLGRDGALRAASPGAAEALRRLVAAAAAGAEGAMAVPRPSSGRAALALHAVPLPAAPRPSVLLLLSDPAGCGATADAALQGRLRAVYGLTAAEAAVAAGAARGVGLPEVARSLGLAVATARTHAQRVFGKAGVRGQAELARQVERLSLVRAARER
jgi:DNA-binding CsgD family transcriptional regulator